MLAVAVSVALGALFLWLPRRYAPVLPALVALGFFLTWVPLQLWIHSFPRLSSATYTTGISAGKSWVTRLFRSAGGQPAIAARLDAFRLKGFF